MGDENEGIFCARDLLPAWEHTPEGLTWLKLQAPAKKGKKKR